MGTSTKLYISTNWRLDDLKTVIEKHLEYSVIVETTCVPQYVIFNMTKDNKKARCLNIFISTSTPLGSSICLDLGADDEGIQLLKEIAQVMGGFFQEKDSRDKFVWIDGMLKSGDGLQYFLKYATINNELVNDNDLKGLNQSIIKWQEKCNSHTVDTFKED